VTDAGHCDPGRRRQFLSGLLAFAALPAAGVIPAGHDTLGRWLRRVAQSTPEARLLGSRYLARHPAERSAGHLSAALFGRALREPIDEVSQASLLRRLDAAHQRNLHDGDLVVLDGWCLTSTEARMLALLTLVPG
jgi:hypothetical protein